MTKEIPLNGKYGLGASILVDADMHPYLSKKNWYLVGKKGKRYAMSANGKRGIYLHHAVLGYTPWHKEQGLVCDHINRDKLDNRRENLRMVSIGFNNANVIRPRNFSGYRGVYASDKSPNWVAKIMHDGKRIHIGTYLTKEEAAAEYDKVAVQLYGANAILNSALQSMKGGE